MWANDPQLVEEYSLSFYVFVFPARDVLTMPDRLPQRRHQDVCNHAADARRTHVDWNGKGRNVPIGLHCLSGNVTGRFAFYIFDCTLLSNKYLCVSVPYLLVTYLLTHARTHTNTQRDTQRDTQRHWTLPLCSLVLLQHFNTVEWNASTLPRYWVNNQSWIQSCYKSKISGAKHNNSLVLEKMVNEKLWNPLEGFLTVSSVYLSTSYPWIISYLPSSLVLKLKCEAQVQLWPMAEKILFQMFYFLRYIITKT